MCLLFAKPHTLIYYQPVESRSHNLDLSPAMLELGAKLYPRRINRFKDLRPYHEACDWADGLDWQSNPYDRFLLRRELLRHLAEIEIHKPLNIFTFASRSEIAAKVDEFISTYSEKYGKQSPTGVFQACLVILPFDLAYNHGFITYSHLAKALATMADV